MCKCIYRTSRWCNVTCDIDKKLAKVGNYVENSDEDGIHTVYIIGKADLSKVEVVPVNFYVDDEDDYEVLRMTQRMTLKKISMKKQHFQSQMM